MRRTTSVDPRRLFAEKLAQLGIETEDPGEIRHRLRMRAHLSFLKQAIPTAIASLLICLAIYHWIWPSVYRFEPFHFFFMPEQGFDHVIKNSWIVLAWGAGFTFLAKLLLSKPTPWEKERAGLILRDETFTSATAGLFEEFFFRWIVFVAAMPGIVFGNWLLGGFLGPDWGIPQFLYVWIACPIANFFSFGLIEHILNHELGWVVGASVIAANVKFRDGHKYQGPLGLINSWYIGLFFFYLMFEYGIWAAVLIHFLYDLFIAIVNYIITSMKSGAGE